MALRFEKTCDACPEQWDVWDGDKIVAYVRLRWSHLSVTCPNVGSREVVYSATIGTTGYDGEFEDEAQRTLHLKLAEAAIEDWMRRNYD